MKHGMLGAAYVEVDRHPVFLLGRIDECLCVLRIDVPQVVPAGTAPLRHGVGLALCGAAALGTSAVDPAVDVCQRALSRAGRLIACDFRQGEGKLVLRNKDCSAVRAVDEGDGLSPVSLAAEDPVAQLEVHHLVSDLALLEELDHACYGISLVESVQETAVDVDSVFGPWLLLDIDLGLEDLDDGQVELFGKLPVTGVVGRDCHDGAGSV